MTTNYGTEWVRNYVARLNSDKELSVIGKHFNVSVRLDFGTSRYILYFRDGAVFRLVEVPRLDDRYDYGFRAPAEVWSKFTSTNPPAMYHDYFAMLMRVPEFELDGDVKIMMQNVRATQRVMALMRGEAK